MQCCAVLTRSDVLQVAAERPVELTAEKQVDEAVFQQAFIARKLEEVEHFERDSKRLLEGKSKDIYFTTLTGMAADGTGAGSQPKVLMASQNTSSSALDKAGGSNGANEALDSTQQAAVLNEGGFQLGAEEGEACVAHSNDENETDSEVGHADSQASDVTGVEEGEWSERSKLSPEEVRDARKANKQVVKEKQKEKRLSKIPKKVKKRAEKKGKVKK